MTSEEDGRLRIAVPARRCWPLAIFLAVWLCGWTLGEVAGLAWTISLLAKPDLKNLFAPVWLTCWTAAGAFAWQVLLWQVSGREILIVDSDRFIHRYQMRAFSHQREISLRRVCRLRATIAPVQTDAIRPRWAASAAQQWGIAGGHITFDCEGRTYGAGSGLDEAEAKQIVALLLQRHPELSSEHER